MSRPKYVPLYMKVFGAKYVPTQIGPIIYEVIWAKYVPTQNVIQILKKCLLFEREASNKQSFTDFFATIMILTIFLIMIFSAKKSRQNDGVYVTLQCKQNFTIFWRKKINISLFIFFFFSLFPDSN